MQLVYYTTKEHIDHIFNFLKLNPEYRLGYNSPHELQETLINCKYKWKGIYDLSRIMNILNSHRSNKLLPNINQGIDIIEKYLKNNRQSDQELLQYMI